MLLGKSRTEDEQILIIRFAPLTCFNFKSKNFPDLNQLIFKSGSTIDQRKNPIESPCDCGGKKGL